MTWIKIDDHYDEHPKHAQVGPLGQALWLAGLAYCNRNLTDGFIPWSTAQGLVTWEFLGLPDDQGRRKVHRIGVSSGTVGEDVSSKFVIHLLVEAELWEEVSDGYQIHDYSKYQPTKAQILEGRGSKQAAGQAGGKMKAYNRDRAKRLSVAAGAHTQEEWQEMIDVYGGFLICNEPIVVKDHVISLLDNGDNNITNLQPLCRSYNARKGNSSTDYRIGRSETLAKSYQTPSTGVADYLAESKPVPVPLKETSSSQGSEDVKKIPPKKVLGKKSWEPPEFYLPLTELPGYKHLDHSKHADMVKISCVEAGVDVVAVVAAFAEDYPLLRRQYGWTDPSATLRGKPLAIQIQKALNGGKNGRGDIAEDPLAKYREEARRFGPGGEGAGEAGDNLAKYRAEAQRFRRPVTPPG